MSRPNFTPGPWNSQPYKNGTTRFRIIQNPYGLIAEVKVGNPANPRVNTEADARLIAAAPALYEALTRMRCTCDASSRYGHYDGPHCNATIARDAIALVESESA